MPPDLKDPKLIAYAVMLLLSTLAGIGWLSPSAMAGLQDPVSKCVEALIVLVTNGAILYQAFRTQPSVKPAPTSPPKTPAADGEPTLFQ